MRILAKTNYGLEELLEQEFIQLGFQDIQRHTRAISGKGNLELLYRLNYESRYALRVLVPLMEGDAGDQEQLYKLVQKVDWSQYITCDSLIAFDSSENQSSFNNTMFISMKAKDAVVDQMRTADGKRPTVSIENPDLLVNLHIFKNRCIISLDASGYSLHKRGYKAANVMAPLNEVLASAIIKLSGWDMQHSFVDGMTGSGTIAIEAALMARNYPAGYFSDGFAFQRWRNYDKNLWKRVVERANEKITDSDAKIFAVEMDTRAYEAARTNIEEAGLTDAIELVKADFFQFQHNQEKGVLLLNPPYGERLSLEDVQAFYKRIGDTLKNNYKGFEAHIITSNSDGLKSIGLKTSKKTILFNGGVECRLLKYELYDGTRKIRPADSPLLKDKENREDHQ
jgi:putative N6-adenine-specific DNA methylase